MNFFLRNPILEKIPWYIGIFLEFLLDFQMNIHWNFLDFHRINSKISYRLLWNYEKNPKNSTRQCQQVPFLCQYSFCHISDEPLHLILFVRLLLGLILLVSILHRWQILWLLKLKARHLVGCLSISKKEIFVVVPTDIPIMRVK